MTSPFELLGLDADAGLTDDDVRSAWRRIAAATHPDRADGGDPAGFAAAAAAYTLLRTATGRGEALAELTSQCSGGVRSDPVPGKNRLVAKAAAAGRRIGHGRPVRLTARLLAAITAGALAVAAVGWQPASAAIITGALTWLFITGRQDVVAQLPQGAPRPPRR